MGKLKNFRFDLPIMFCMIAIIAVVILMAKALYLKYDEANRPTLHVYATCFNLQNYPAWMPIRQIKYSVTFPGRPHKPTDYYCDDCTGLEPGFLNQVDPSGSKTTYYAMEPGLVTNPRSVQLAITARMKANFELLKENVAEHYDIHQIDWSPDQSGGKIFSLDLKLPADFPTALP